MNKGLYFLLGAICGAAGTYLFMKNRFEEQERELYSEKYKNKEEEMYAAEESQPEVEHKPTQNPDIMEYAKKLSDMRYAKMKEEEKAERNLPYIIRPDDLNDKEYERVSLTYYADDILAYEVDDEIVENADELIGDDFEDHFGEFEENMIYVRDDENQTDYMIFKDERTYEEVSGNKPHGTEE